MFNNREFRLETPALLETLNEFEHRMLSAHNNVRKRHGLNHVLWSKKLAARARRWGIRLSVLNKSHLRSNIIVSTHNHPSFGQNIGLVLNRKLSTSEIIEQTIVDWYGETVKRYDYSCEAPKPELFSFTQMIWDKTVRIGGCLTWFGDIGFVIINYWPAGNLEGQFINNVFPAILGAGIDMIDDFSGEKYFVNSVKGYAKIQHNATVRKPSKSVEDMKTFQEVVSLNATDNITDDSHSDTNTTSTNESRNILNHEKSDAVMTDISYEGDITNSPDKLKDSETGDFLEITNSPDKLEDPETGNELDNNTIKNMENFTDENKNDENIQNNQNDGQKTSESMNPNKSADTVLFNTMKNDGKNNENTDEDYVEIAELDINKTMENSDDYVYMSSISADAVDQEEEHEYANMGGFESEYMTMKRSTEYTTPDGSVDVKSVVNRCKPTKNDPFESKNVFYSDEHDYETLSRFKVKKKKSRKKKVPTNCKDIPFLMVQSGLALAVYQEPPSGDLSSESDGRETYDEEDTHFTTEIKEKIEGRSATAVNVGLDMILPEYEAPDIEDGIIEEDLNEVDFVRNSVLEELVTEQIEIGS